MENDGKVVDGVEGKEVLKVDPDVPKSDGVVVGAPKKLDDAPCVVVVGVPNGLFEGADVLGAPKKLEVVPVADGAPNGCEVVVDGAPNGCEAVDGAPNGVEVDGVPNGLVEVVVGFAPNGFEFAGAPNG